MDAMQAATDGAIETLTPTARSLNVTVLMGGPSDEREVSLLSGKTVADALERAGHHVRRADIGPADTTALDREQIDVVFIALHGDFGESGQVQQLCDERGLAYIGSDPQASQLAMDKSATKRTFERAGLTTPAWCVVETHHRPGEATELVEAIPLPVVLKPVSGGSSLDITIARDSATVRRALAGLLARHGRAMVEHYVSGRELTVGIVGDTALPIIEIIPPGEFYDYRAKYTDCGTRYVFDHGLDESLSADLARAALKAHRAIGCRDLSRVDLILDDAGDAQMLEINTIPGFTSHSLLPMAAERAGVGIEKLVDAIVAMAVQRHSRTSAVDGPGWAACERPVLSVVQSNGSQDR